MTWATSPRLLTALIMLTVLAGCAGSKPPPDWQMNAHGALQRSVQAYLVGNDRVAGAELDRARAEISTTGRIDLMARAELLRCAAQAAALAFDDCPGFERLRADAAPADQAYADLLRGRLQAGQAALLPAPQQALAQVRPGSDGEAAALQAVADPLSRLLGAALLLHAGGATAASAALAVDTASAQGWRRPLLAWLRLQQLRAERAGDATEALRLGRRIELVLSAGSPTAEPR